MNSNISSPNFDFIDYVCAPYIAYTFESKLRVLFSLTFIVFAVCYVINVIIINIVNIIFFTFAATYKILKKMQDFIFILFFLLHIKIKINRYSIM